MPLYEYRCTQCGHVFEKIQSFSAPDEKECPKCKGPVERLLSAPAIQFKGSGFYLTDYGKAGSGASKSGSSSESKGDGGASSSKGDGASSASGAAAFGGSSSATSSSTSPSTPASGTSKSGSSGSGSSSTGSGSSGTS